MMYKYSGMSRSEVLIGVVLGVAILGGIGSVVLLDATGEKGSGLSDEYKFDVSMYAKTDPELVLYEEVESSIKTGLKEAKAIAVDSGGVIYVAADEVIKKVNSTSIKLSGTPLCLTVTDEGGIYVGLKDHVEVYDSAGKLKARWKGLGDKAVLTSIAVGEDDVFVADAGNRIVIRYDMDGNVVGRIGAKDEKRNIGGFVIPSPYFDLAIADDGLLRVVNPGEHKIEAYTFDGDLEFSWGKATPEIDGFCGCCNPINFAILEDGSFVTCEKGLIRVKVYDPDGKFVGVVAGVETLVEGGFARACDFPADCQMGGFDVAVGNDGRVFVLDTNKGVVRTFTKKDSSGK